MAATIFVIRGAHPQTALIDAVRPALRILAELLDQLAADLLDEIAADLRIFGRAAQHSAQRFGHRRIILRAGDEVVAEHLAQHIGAALQCAVGMADGVVIGRPLGQHRQIGHLPERQLVQFLVEIGMRRRLDAERVPAQCDLVEIELQDLRLGQRRLDLIGEDRLPDLAGRRVSVADQQVLGDLLCRA